MSDEMKYEADVKIRPHDGAWSILINGEEMAGQILADSLVVTFPSNEFELGTARVQMTLAAKVDLESPGFIETEQAHICTPTLCAPCACSAQEDGE